MLHQGVHGGGHSAVLCGGSGEHASPSGVRVVFHRLQQIKYKWRVMHIAAYWMPFPGSSNSS